MKINTHNNTNSELESELKYIENIFNSINDDYEFNIIFVHSDEIKEINKNYRDKDYITDVISFPSSDEEEENYIGDIFICIEKALEQSQVYSHTYEREISFLAVHGYLHLLGYDHINEEDEKLMIEKQKEILNKANIWR